MAAEAVGFIHDSPKVCGDGDSPEWLQGLWGLYMIPLRSVGMEILLNGCRGCGVYT